MQNYIAHIKEDQNGKQIEHLLDDHQRQVAEMAANFATEFGGQDWAKLAGLWHDLGKYRPGFQQYIRQIADAHCEHSGITPTDKTHSAAGAIFAIQSYPTPSKEYGYDARILVYLIAGHHAGLADWNGLDARLFSPDGIQKQAKKEFDEAIASAPRSSVSNCGIDPTIQKFIRDLPGKTSEEKRNGFHLWVRMLFSSLVDADFLDTEKFMDDRQSEARKKFPNISDLKRNFDEYMSCKIAPLANTTPVNRIRSDILRQCREKSGLQPGVYTLTVPTGGGKTLSSLAFALNHALVPGKQKKRIIVTIPYTSIIEQNADVFRMIFGENAFIEHHSNAEADENKENRHTRLACENWDAPLIVTTNVQLFESLFANRTSRCRKLHNIANSIIILDEAQLLPPQYLQPILDVMNLLVKYYGVTLLLMTATQPALHSREFFDPVKNIRGLDGATDLINNPIELYKKLKRVQVYIPNNFNETQSWEDIAERIRNYDCILVIVNSRRHARALVKLLPEGTIHLSALMCGQHRSDVITDIRVRLEAKRNGTDDRPLRVVSTQLIEAGVDVDFPVVYRALAGLDSIAQAAGRCNREGRNNSGEVHVFIPPQPPPPGLLRLGEQATRHIWGNLKAEQDPLDITLFSEYFTKLYYDSAPLDPKEIISELTSDVGSLAVNFKTAAQKFQLIDDAEQATIFVRYCGPNKNEGTFDRLVGSLERVGPTRDGMRKLQRYAVNVYQYDVRKWIASGDVKEMEPGIYVQFSSTLYDYNFGVNVDGAPGDPADYIQ